MKKAQQGTTKKTEPSSSKAKPDHQKQPLPADDEKGWKDPKFNGAELTMGQLQDMIKSLAKEVYEKKYEDLKTDLEEEVEWRVTAQCEEIEETVETLKDELKTMKQELTNTKQELNTIKKERETLKEENSKLKRCVERCEYKLSCIKRKQLKDLKIKIDEVEQKTLERDVQIVGIPELPEDLNGSEDDEMQLIVKLADEKMGITLKTSNIEKIHRLGKRRTEKDRDLVVRFKSNTMRNKFYKKRKQTSNNLDQRKNVYINDCLTEYRRNLFYSARQLVKRKIVFAAWSQQGNILIRKNEDDPPIHVHSHDHLAELQLIESTEIPADPDYYDTEVEDDENDSDVC